MAARQDQTIVIVNIMCVVLALALIVITYFQWKYKGEAYQQLAATNTRLTDAESKSRSYQGDATDMRQKVGFGENDTKESIASAFEADMKKYLPSYDPGKSDASYRSVLNELDLRRQNAETSDANNAQQLLELRGRLTAVEAEKDAQIKAAQDAAAKAQGDAAAQLNRFNADRAANAEVQSKLLATLDEQRAGYDAQIGERDAKITQLTDQVAKMQKSIDGLLERLKPLPGSFDVADGEITYVNQGGTVWVNLGSADALRPLVTFGVYDKDAQNTAKAKQKGTIEITRVIGERLAEARVTADDPRDPILSGDKIYSPAWHRGRQLHFAFTGIIDVNGDGLNDIQLVRNLVGVNGGVVDAYLAEDGTVDGALTVNTRYLVLGSFPAGATQTKLSEGWQAMNKEATTLGIETLSLDQFLDQMGYRPDSRAVQLGTNATAEDFPARQFNEAPASGISTTPGRFRPRTPPPAASPRAAPGPARELLER